TKANAPGREELRSGAVALLCRSRLAPLELGFGPWLLFRRLTLRLGPRLAARWGSLAPRLGARWWRLSAPPLLRHRATRRLRRLRRLRGLLRPLRAIGTLVVLGPLRTVAPRRPIGLIGAAGVVPMIGLVRTISVIALVWPTTATAIVVVPLLVGARATPGRLNVGGRNDARAAQVTTAYADVAPTVVVHGPLAHPRNECIRRLPVLEDEPGLRPVRTREDDPRAAVVPIRIVVRIIEHHHPKAHG